MGLTGHDVSRHQTGDGELEHSSVPGGFRGRDRHQRSTEKDVESPPFYITVSTLIGFIILIAIGKLRDIFGKIFSPRHFLHLRIQDGYAPLNSDFDDFYTRRLKHRFEDCFGRPVHGVPGRFITLQDRAFVDSDRFELTGTTTKCLNLGSYNYLGFARADGPCVDAVSSAIGYHGLSFTGSQGGLESLLQTEVEDLTAAFIGKPSALIFSMGFSVNASIFPALLDERCLVISDELNHASIRFGCRLAGARIKTFRHNDVLDLERVLRREISCTKPVKILVAVEGLYSMEGAMCKLPALVSLKKKYKFSLFVDEAHSIGALGARGRGVCDHFGVNPSEVDVLMGTFSKSFGACGGYVASTPDVVRCIRRSLTGTAMEFPAPAVLTQIRSALEIIASPLEEAGRNRLQRLAFNAKYLRFELRKRGFIVYGDDESPVVPLIVFNTAKMPAFSREMLRRKIAVVVVGYPATPMMTARVRFCVSAAHTLEDLDRVLEVTDELGDVLDMKLSRRVPIARPKRKPAKGFLELP